MKLSKKLLSAITFLFILTVSVSAQRGERGGDRERSPEKRAEKQTQRLVEDLGLDEAQASKVKEINLMYAEKLQKMRIASREAEEASREKSREETKPIREEQEAALIAVFTPEQSAKFAEMKKNREGKGRRGGKGKKGSKEGRKLK